MCRLALDEKVLQNLLSCGHHGPHANIESPPTISQGGSFAEIEYLLRRRWGDQYPVVQPHEAPWVPMVQHRGGKDAHDPSLEKFHHKVERISLIVSSISGQKGHDQRQ